MSDKLCSHCTLKEIRRAAKKRGATVRIKRATVAPWAGWTTVWQSDRGPEHTHRFMQLTKECAC